MDIGEIVKEVEYAPLETEGEIPVEETPEVENEPVPV